MQYVARSGSLALSAATARTSCRVAATSAIGLELAEMFVGFDGTSATAVPVLVELFTDSGVSGGTSASITLAQMRGSTATATVTAASYSVEPTYTTLVVLKEWLIPPTSGLLLQFPLGREPEGQPGSARASLGLRVTAPATVNVRCYLEVVQGPS
jgi:hypothetical protein